MQKIYDESKTPGIDDHTGIFLKDGTTLTTAIAQLCILSISYETFPDAWKIVKLKSLPKKG